VIPTTVFPSIDAAIDDMREVLPIMREAQRQMELRGETGSDLYRRNADALKLLEDRDAMRARLSRLARPDGSVHFSFTPEAWKLLRDSGMNHV
jgi:DNA repair photolyase